MTVLRVKASCKEEFDDACSDGAVFGTVVTSRPIYFVYVELGEERDYHRSFKDDEKTDYKIFYNCKAFYASSQENLDCEIYDKSSPNLTVIVCGNSQQKE